MTGFLDITGGKLLQFLGAWQGAGGTVETAEALSHRDNKALMALAVSAAEAIAQGDPWLPDVKWGPRYWMALSPEWTYLTSSVRIRVREGWAEVQAHHGHGWVQAMDPIEPSTEIHTLLPFVRFRLMASRGPEPEYYVWADAAYQDDPRVVSIELTQEWCQALPGLMTRITWQKELQAMRWYPNPTQGGTDSIPGLMQKGQWVTVTVQYEGFATWHQFVAGFECRAVPSYRIELRAAPVAGPRTP